MSYPYTVGHIGFHTLPEKKQAQTLAWLESHGISPDVVPEFTVNGITTTVQRHALNDKGRKYADGDHVAMADPVVVADTPPLSEDELERLAAIG